MKSKLEQFQNSGIVVDEFEYRGYTLKFYEDLSGRQLVTVWKDLLFEFGRDNMSYRDDAKLLVDDYLDTLTRFPEYPEFWGAKLEYFQNGSFSDLRLIYKGRILKLYLCKSSTRDPDLEAIVLKDAITVLHTYINC